MTQGTGNGTLDDILNYGTQVVSFGQAGFDAEKGFSTDAGTGLSGALGLEPYKEISGAKAAEEANKIAREQFEQAQEQAEEDRSNQLKQNRQRQVAQSNAAASARNVNTRSTTGSANNLGAGQTDFLGL